MKADLQFEANERIGFGKGAARAERRAGRIPAVLYAKDKEPVTFSLEQKAIAYSYQKGGFYNKIIEIELGGTKYNALPKEIELHPVTDTVLHADFLHIDDNSEISVRVPLKLHNYDRCIGVKRGGALNIVRRTIDVICKHDTIPAKIDIDLAKINIGDSVHISDIKLPENTRSAIQDRDFTILTVTGRAKKDATESEGEGETAEAAA